MWLSFHRNPFPTFFKRGLNVTLTTDDPLQFHMSAQPQLEEYITAKHAWGLTMTDLSEIARNSVLISSASHELKEELIGGTDPCDRCNVPMVVLGSEALLGCKTCGRTRLYVQATSFNRAYKEDGREFSGFNYKYSYKRSHHMQDWIHLVQGKETAEVHADVITHVMQEFVLRRITSKDAIDAKKVREVLKSLKLRKYYDNVAQITARITGKPPPRMTLDQESQCLLMFHAVEQLWPIHCPADRRNFLSYSYCLYKFCELLGWDYLLPNFSLLKGKDKLQRQDAIWKKICDDLEWDYFPSI